MSTADDPPSGDAGPRGPGAFGLGELVVSPIGIVRSPFVEKMAAPRQPAAARDVTGTIELMKGRGLEHAVMDLAEWDHIWVLFWFHLNTGWKPKVQPPRSKTKRGVLSTRSPHRPNPIGLSVVRLDSVDGLTLHVRDLDIVDGTPVLDIKPYVSYADSVPSAKRGWLDPQEESLREGGSDLPSSEGLPSDPLASFEIRWSEQAREQLSFLSAEHGVDVEAPIAQVLRLGPEPHPYRRIRKLADGRSRLAFKSWRVVFHVEDRLVEIERVATGYRKRELESASGGEPAELAIHRAFVDRFGEAGK